MSDFGTTLREARERRGIALRHIADRTKISMSALEALERSDASRLPGGIFARSIVRSYAAEVGLDPDATVQAFLDRFSDEARFAVISLTAAAEPAPAPAPRIAGTVLKLLVVGLVAIGIILYFTVMWHPADPSPKPRPDSARRATPGQAMIDVSTVARLS